MLFCCFWESPIGKGLGMNELGEKPRKWEGVCRAPNIRQQHWPPAQLNTVARIMPATASFPSPTNQFFIFFRPLSALLLSSTIYPAFYLYAPVLRAWPAAGGNVIGKGRWFLSSSPPPIFSIRSLTPAGASSSPSFILPFKSSFLSFPSYLRFLPSSSAYR